MTLAPPLATDNATTQQQPPTPQLAHDDADYTRLHAATVRRLTHSVRRLVSGLRRAGSDDGERVRVATAFVHRHTALLGNAYEDAHTEGMRDYYQQVSLKQRGHRMPAPSTERVRQRLAYYAVVSVAKMAHEALTTHRKQQSALTFADWTDLVDWQDSVGARLDLQAEITWSGLNDGALDAGGLDPANPFAALWWVLGVVKTDHCEQCPLYAAASPYDPPWTGGGIGGNQLDATPGDGHTDCGAACHCRLTFETPDSATQWNALYEGLASIYASDPTAYAQFVDQAMAAGVEEGEPLLPESVPSQAVLLDSQKQALDLYRATVMAWDEWRGLFPPMPDLMGDSGDFFAALPEWGFLSPKQQSLVDQALEAVLLWGQATRNFMAGTGNETFSNQAFADYERGMVFYNHKHGPDGRFAPGHEVVPGEGEGGHEGGGIHGAGNRMVAQAHHAGSGGAGGGGSAGNAQHIAQAENELKLAHEEHQQRRMERAQAEQARMAAIDRLNHIGAQHPTNYMHPDVTAAVGALRASTDVLQHARDQEAFAARRVRGIEAQIDILKGGTGVQIHYHDTALRTGKEAIHTVFGRDLSEHELAALAGAKAGDHIDVRPEGDGFRAGVAGPHLSRDFEVYTDHQTGDIVLHDHYTRNLDARTTQSAGEIVHGLQAMERLGISRIECNAARSAGLNGYRTWPKLGFDGPIPIHVLSRAQAEFGPHVTNVSDIMREPRGPAWWKQNGDSFNATFSFRQGTYSRQVFDGWVRAEQQRAARGQPDDNKQGS